MRIDNICPQFEIKPWKPAQSQVPHLTIETNMTCNFKCHSCYNLNTNYVKDLKLVFEEIDTGLRMRKVDTITIMGGEPTLYPDLVKVIRYIKSKGIFCQMLTNGFLIYSDHKDLLLNDIKSAGLDRIILHVDKGQDIYRDPPAVLHSLFAKTGKLNLLTSISWTIYKNEQGYLPELLKEFSSYKNFDGILALLEKPMDLCVLPGFNRNQYPNLLEEHTALNNRMNLQPSVYLPNSLDDNSVSWLVYMYFINSTTFQTFYLSPGLTRIFQKTYNKIFKKEMFGKPPMRSSFGLSLVATGLMEMLANPLRISSLLKLFKNSGGFSNIRFHYLAIQDSPSYNNVLNNVAICYGCPDATVRNGKLTPVCLADRINPLNNDNSMNKEYKEIEMHVFDHLGQN